MVYACILCLHAHWSLVYILSKIIKRYFFQDSESFVNFQRFQVILNFRAFQNSILSFLFLQTKSSRGKIAILLTIKYNNCFVKKSNIMNENMNNLFSNLTYMTFTLLQQILKIIWVHFYTHSVWSYGYDNEI